MILQLVIQQVVEKFVLLYDSVDDIDLFIAAVSEKKADGALVGPTFSCIVADQFSRLKLVETATFTISTDRPVLLVEVLFDSIFTRNLNFFF